LERRRWLISQRADFWFSSAAASAALLAALALIFFYGDREFDWLDLVLSELHLGATYDAIIRRRLWRRLPTDVLLVPLIILGATSLLISKGQLLFVTSISMYAAIWHRGRQNFGIARFYQRLGGGQVSRAHAWLFSGAIYAPMVAAALLYSHLVPEQYDFEGEPYYGLDVGAHMAWALGVVAFSWVAAYLFWTWRRNRQHCPSNLGQEHQASPLHPGERWIVLAHAVAFGSAYVLGAAQASFLFVLTVHHEVQYLYFTYAMARWPVYPAQAQNSSQNNVSSEVRFGASFALWPVIGLAGTIVSGWYPTDWLASLGVGGLFCHYWLDGRIWTKRAMRG
jgi:hypothetical protein